MNLAFPSDNFQQSVRKCGGEGGDNGLGSRERDFYGL